MGLGVIIDQLLGQIINIPLINPLSYLYIILNLIFLIFATLFGGGDQESLFSF